MAIEIGTKDMVLVDCLNKFKNVWVIRFNPQEQAEGACSYEVEYLTHKPTVDEVKAIITEKINDGVQQAIYSGMKYDGNTVYLSMENQFNYKSAYDLAVQTNGENLPVTFKFGENYKTFETVDELKDFYLSVSKHVQLALEAGYDKKKNINMEAYESVLNTRN